MTLTVPDVGRGEPPPAVASVEVDKNARLVRVLDPSGRWLAAYPASIGSEEKPAPSGVAEIKRVAHNPTYHYDPHFAFKGVKTKRAFTIAAGPNNPVGAVWIDLSIESYGIHGTPEPGNIGATFSHGCIRLTNWDAEDLASMVQKGTKVNFKDDMADDGEAPADWAIQIQRLRQGASPILTTPPGAPLVSTAPSYSLAEARAG